MNPRFEPFGNVRERHDDDDCLKTKTLLFSAVVVVFGNDTRNSAPLSLSLSLSLFTSLSVAQSSRAIMRTFLRQCVQCIHHIKMNARQAPPDDWSGLLKKEEEALITIMKERALSSCAQTQKNYYECVKGRTLSIVWKCREEGNALNECLHRETSEEKLNDVKRKWLKAGKPRVGTRSGERIPVEFL